MVTVPKWSQWVPKSLYHFWYCHSVWQIICQPSLRFSFLHIQFLPFTHDSGLGWRIVNLPISNVANTERKTSKQTTKPMTEDNSQLRLEFGGITELWTFKSVCVLCYRHVYTCILHSFLQMSNRCSLLDVCGPCDCDNLEQSVCITKDKLRWTNQLLDCITVLAPGSSFLGIECDGSDYQLREGHLKRRSCPSQN